MKYERMERITNAGLSDLLAVVLVNGQRNSDENHLLLIKNTFW